MARLPYLAAATLASVGLLRGIQKTSLSKFRAPSFLKPHQGVRECARRVGGTLWDSYRATDRVRRGLPPFRDGGADG